MKNEKVLDLVVPDGRRSETATYMGNAALPTIVGTYGFSDGTVARVVTRPDENQYNQHSVVFDEYMGTPLPEDVVPSREVAAQLDPYQAPMELSDLES